MKATGLCGHMEGNADFYLDSADNFIIKTSRIFRGRISLVIQNDVIFALTTTVRAESASAVSRLGDTPSL